ncbi:MAG: hypothetical protein ACLVB1_12135 [Blautia obeum]
MIKVLNATVATIRYADVEAWDDWGIIVNGAYASGSNNTSYTKAAGGFAGNLEELYSVRRIRRGRSFCTEYPFCSRR